MGRLRTVLMAGAAAAFAALLVWRGAAPANPLAPRRPLAGRASPGPVPRGEGELAVEGLSEPEIEIGWANVKEIEAPMREIADASALGGRALTVPEGPNHQELHPKDKRGAGGGWVPNGTATFTFVVKAPGKYVLWAHKRWCCSCGDSFRFAVDGGPLLDFKTDSNYGVWEWAALKGQRIELGEGAHTLAIANREDGFRVDRFLLTTGDYTPAPPKRTEAGERP